MAGVFANSMEIASKAADGKVIAAFPDVCMSPPPPPAGPVPVPYPDSSFSRDLKQGSKSVKIGGGPVALRDQSYYKSSPLGDEAATRNFGASVLSHTITGKTYFGAWSFDVQFEGKNVPRHLDITTSNHASYPGSTPPFPNMEAMTALAQQRIAADVCPCCGGEKHAKGKPMGRDEWYHDNIDKQGLDLQAKKGWSDTERRTWSRAQKQEYRALIARATSRPNCTCPRPTRVLPCPPCDVFYGRPPPGPKREAQQKAIEKKWNDYRSTYQKKVGIPSVRKTRRMLTTKLGRPPTTEEIKVERETMHLTPKAAGGCPTGDMSRADNGNLQAKGALCSACRAIDKAFNKFQQ